MRSANGFITLSLEHGADVQVVFTSSERMELISRLQQGVSDTESEAKAVSDLRGVRGDRALVAVGCE